MLSVYYVHIHVWSRNKEDEINFRVYNSAFKGDWHSLFQEAMVGCGGGGGGGGSSCVFMGKKCRPFVTVSK